MKKASFILGAVVGLVVACRAAEMEMSTPEAEGVSSVAIGNWITACERELDALHGFVIVRHGKTIAEGWWAPFSADHTHILYSQSKSFISTAVGFLVDDGKLDLDARVADFFPGQVPPKALPKFQALRVRDLLSMNTGNLRSEPELRHPAGDWLAQCLANPIAFDPGTRFLYDSGNTYMLAALVEKVSGEKVMDLLGRRLFQPIGIEKAWSTTSPQGIACGGWGMNMTTRELARFGLLLLQEGRWGDRQVISRDWVRLATSKQTFSRRGSVPDLHQGYGFQFWRCRHNGYMAYGHLGQFLIVLPDQDAVISLQGGLEPIEKELDLVWKHLFPAMKSAPLPPDPVAARLLRERTARLSLKPVRGEAAAFADAFGKTYDLRLKHRLGFKTVRLEERDEGCEIVFGRARGKEVRIPVGYGTWREGVSVFEDATYESLFSIIGNQPTAASGAWKGRTFTFRAYLHETFFRLDGTLTFKDDGRLSIALNLWGRSGGWTRGTGQAR